MKTCRIAIWLAAIAFISLAWPRTVAGDGDAGYRIGMILWRGETRAEAGFRAYLEHRGIRAHYVVRDCEQDEGKLARILAEMASQDLDLLYTFGTTVTLAAGGFDPPGPRPAGDVPIVFNIVADPVGAGIVPSFENPGRNITGVTHMVPVERQLSLLDFLAPGDVVGALYNPNEANSRIAVDELATAGAARGVKVVRQALIPPNGAGDRPARIAAAVAGLAAWSPDYVYLPSDSFIVANAAAIVDACHERGIPTISATEGPIRTAGALMGIVSPYWASGQFAAHKAMQIVRDRAPPDSIPVGRLSRFTFLFHIGAAHRLRFYPPVKMFRFAEVIGQSW